MKRYLLSALLLMSSLCGCRKSMQNDVIVRKSTYDVKICYRGCFNERISLQHKSSYSLSPDSLYVFVEKGFEDDLMIVYINDAISLEDTITTDPRVDFSDVYTFGNSDNIKEIAFKINNGRKAQMEIDESIRLINVNYEDSTLIISVLKTAPIYD